MAEDVFIVIMNKNWQYNLFPLQRKYWINLVWPFPEAGFDRHSVFMHLFDSDGLGKVKLNTGQREHKKNSFFQTFMFL